MNPFEKSGLWWLPFDPNKIVSGVLTFSDERDFSLDLMGTLDDAEDIFQVDGTVNYLLILGVTDDNTLCTLHQCIQQGTSFLSVGITTQRFRVNVVYTGVHCTKVEELIFSQARFQYSHLLSWAGISGLSSSFPTEVDNKYTLSYERPEDIIVQLPNGTLSFISTFRMSPGAPAATMTESTFVRVNVSEPLSFSEWLSHYITPIQDWLSLATCRPNAVTRVIFRIDAENEGSDGATRKVDVEAFYESVYYDKQEPKKIKPPDMVFELGDLDGLETVMNKWLWVRKDLNTFCNLFFSSQYGPAKYIESRFLITAQAAELYHRERFANFLQPKADYKKLVKSIVASVPKEHKSWLKEQLAFSNEPRLLQRIQDLIELSWDVLEPIVKDKDQFAKKVKDTRNYSDPK